MLVAERHAGKESLIVAERVTKRFGSIAALHELSLAVASGEVVCLIGPSGSGKSTFLRCINQLETIDAGAIWIGEQRVGYKRVPAGYYPLSDRELADQRQYCGMVFQRFNLFGHLTALQNIIEGPIHVQRRPRQAAVDEALALLERVGLPDKRDAYPLQLSGGQQQRIAIARALAMKPKVMLLDEPTSALDPELVGEVLEVIRDLADSGMTMLIVTHELAFARDIADRVVFMDRGEIMETGSPAEVLMNPKDQRTRNFIAAARGHGSRQS